MAVIRFNHVFKKYYLNQPRNLKGALVSMFPSYRKQRKFFWALNDVTFDVRPGETVGIVGPNGAGKSTILKLLSGITAPTKGAIHVDGRVGALINLGAGFHPELTGRENIYLYGSIMGLTRSEIQQHFQQIVDFAGLEEFIDTPVKRYSSGMFVRLGFSTAIHVQPDILLIDEVLAVGDFRFQDKCMEKIRELRKQGTTMLVISHQRYMIEKLCQRAIFLHKGIVHYIGETAQAFDRYFKTVAKEGTPGTTAYTYNVPERECEEEREVRITKICLLDQEGQERTLFMTGEAVRLQIYFDAHADVSSLVPYARIFSENGTDEPFFIHGTNTARCQLETDFQAGESGMAEICYHHMNLLGGRYFFSVGLLKDFFSQYSYDQKDRSIFFTVSNTPLEDGVGTILLEHAWAISKQ